MGQIRIAVDIERPIQHVFGYVTDLRHDVEWFRGIRGVRIVSDVQTGIGTVYEQMTTLFGWRFTARMQVSDYRPPHLMILRTLRSATPFVARYEFDELDELDAKPGPVTRFTLDAEVRGGSAFRLLGPAFMPLLNRAVRSRLTVLKQTLER